MDDTKIFNKKENLPPERSPYEIKTFTDIPSENLVTGGHGTCSGCGPAIGLRLALLALGRKTMIINSAGCFTLQPTYPYNPFKVPWIHLAIENAGAAAIGIYHGLKAQGKEKDVTILAYVGDGATYDIGLQSLSHACQTKTNFIYVCYDNQNFANTGVQQSSATPEKAFTTTTPIGEKIRGNPFRRKSITKIIAAHEIPYVATASVSHPLDFINKLRKAQKIKGPKFIDLLSPCQPGWGFETNEAVQIDKAAVESGAWPLYEIENGKFALNYKPEKLKPIKEYLFMQKRFKHLTQAETEYIQNIVSKEWELLLQGRFWEAVEY